MKLPGTSKMMGVANERLISLLIPTECRTCAVLIGHWWENGGGKDLYELKLILKTTSYFVYNISYLITIDKTICTGASKTTSTLNPVFWGLEKSLFHCSLLINHKSNQINPYKNSHWLQHYLIQFKLL